MQYLEDHFVQLCKGKICNIWRTILYNFVTEKYAILGGPFCTTLEQKNVQYLGDRILYNFVREKYAIFG